MKVFELIQVLCCYDPQTELFASNTGFPPTSLFKIERIYDQYVEGNKTVVLTTKTTNYDKDSKRGG